MTGATAVFRAEILRVCEFDSVRISPKQQSLTQPGYNFQGVKSLQTEGSPQGIWLKGS